jgi:hypothetical protein
MLNELSIAAALLSSSASVPTDVLSSAPLVSICSIYTNPKRYLGRIIRIRGDFISGPHATSGITHAGACPNQARKIPILVRVAYDVGGPASHHFRALQDQPQADVDCFGVQFLGTIKRDSYADMIFEYKWAFVVQQVEDIYMCPGWSRFYAPPLPRLPSGP